MSNLANFPVKVEVGDDDDEKIVVDDDDIPRVKIEKKDTDLLPAHGIDDVDVIDDKKVGPLPNKLCHHNAPGVQFQTFVEEVLDFFDTLGCPCGDCENAATAPSQKAVDNVGGERNVAADARNNAGQGFLEDEKDESARARPAIYTGRPCLTIPAAYSSSDNVDLSMGVMPRPPKRSARAGSGTNGPSRKRSAPAVQKASVIDEQTQQTFPCYYPRCNKMFKRKSNLTQHRNRYHRGYGADVFVFPCKADGCGIIFNTFWELRDHMQLAHPNVGMAVAHQYQCFDCDEFLHSYEDYENHQC